LKWVLVNEGIASTTCRALFRKPVTCFDVVIDTLTCHLLSHPLLDLREFLSHHPLIYSPHARHFQCLWSMPPSIPAHAYCRFPVYRESETPAEQASQVDIWLDGLARISPILEDATTPHARTPLQPTQSRSIATVRRSSRPEKRWKEGEGGRGGNAAGELRARPTQSGRDHHQSSKEEHEALMRKHLKSSGRLNTICTSRTCTKQAIISAIITSTPLAALSDFTVAARIIFFPRLLLVSKCRRGYK
jgi:hypothetical protein